jgi:hypothetical protein
LAIIVRQEMSMSNNARHQNHLRVCGIEFPGANPGFGTIG